MRLTDSGIRDDVLTDTGVGVQYCGLCRDWNETEKEIFIVTVKCPFLNLGVDGNFDIDAEELSEMMREGSGVVFYATDKRHTRLRGVGRMSFDVINSIHYGDWVSLHCLHNVEKSDPEKDAERLSDASYIVAIAKRSDRYIFELYEIDG